MTDESVCHYIPGLQLSWMALLPAADLPVSWDSSPAPDVSQPPSTSSDRGTRASRAIQACSKTLFDRVRYQPKGQSKARGHKHSQEADKRHGPPKAWQGCGCVTLSPSEELGPVTQSTSHRNPNLSLPTRNITKEKILCPLDPVQQIPGKYLLTKHSLKKLNIEHGQVFSLKGQETNSYSTNEDTRKSEVSSKIEILEFTSWLSRLRT